MAAGIATTIHVLGPVIPFSSVGAGSSYVALGECQDGASIQITPAVHGVKADGGGGMDGFPIDYIMLNAIITIRFRLVPFSGTYMNALRALALATPSEGVLPIPGTLFGANGYLPGLYLPISAGLLNAEPDGPWWFPRCLVVRPGDNQVWTKETTPEMEFRAMGYYNPASQTSVGGLSLYQRTAPS